MLLPLSTKMSDQKNDSGYVEFHKMELDDRILKAVAKLGWEKPTLIQERAIPLLLNGKDVLMKARTGSGKTGAFAIPIIQNILKQKQVACEKAVKALILAPSRELCHQIHAHILQLTTKCFREVQCVDISPQTDIEVQRPLLIEHPDILIATPARALSHLQANTFSLKDSLEMLVIDEADLMFSYGYEADVKDVLQYLPLIYQAALASATLSEDVISLKKLVLHNSVIVKLQEPVLAPISQLAHYAIYAEEDDKAAILYVLLKLSLVRGKTIIFVNTVDKCYKLKLFLEQFAIQTCVLNSELPASIRCHSVIQFNEGTYDIIIASDEKTLEDPGESSAKSEGTRKKDKESGVVRGIDFQFVCNIVNFDFPLDVISYIHRAGRTARGTNQGTALSFISVHEKPAMDEVEKHLKIGLSGKENIFKTYHFKLEEVEGFKYRAKDAWRAVTRIAVREARLKEIKQEILNSKKLKGYFLENPKDLKSLRHDKALHTVKLQPHLADVPTYLIPQSLKRVATISESREHKRRKRYTYSGEHKYNKAKQENPLLSMQFSGFNKTKSSKNHDIIL